MKGWIWITQLELKLKIRQNCPFKLQSLQLHWTPHTFPSSFPTCPRDVLAVSPPSCSPVACYLSAPVLGRLFHQLRLINNESPCVCSRCFTCIGFIWFKPPLVLLIFLFLPPVSSPPVVHVLLAGRWSNLHFTNLCGTVVSGNDGFHNDLCKVNNFIRWCGATGLLCWIHSHTV